MVKFSNQHIVNDVARNYQIKSLVNKMIDYSCKDKSNDDLCQYIYICLLEMDNQKLNQMYNDGTNTKNPNRKSTKLRNFISQMIKSQRNGGKNSTNTYYQNYLHIKNSNEYFFESSDIEDNREIDFTFEIILEFIDQKAEMIDGVQYSSEQLKIILAFTILKKYFMSDLTQVALAKHLNLSRGTISKLLKVAKSDILVFWNKTGKHIDYNINLEI